MQQSLNHIHQRVIATSTIAQAERLLKKEEIPLILLDLQLSDGDGREFLSKLRAQPETAAIPVFVISSHEGSQIQTECFALGADAFFQKPFDPTLLATAVASKLSRLKTQAGSSSADSLTGLPNRAAFANGFKRAAMLASRSREPLTAAMLDVDRFKSVNDLYGHSEGDRVLQRLASVVSSSLRASDLLARWGGEEFAVLLPQTKLDQARLALTKALAASRAQTFSTADGRVFRITFSGGIAQVKRGMTMEQAIQEADRLLYLAKASGRDQVLTEKDPVSTKKTILIVEDDDVTASILERHLKSEGFDVIRAKESQEALDAIAKKSISLISLDVKIPGMDGFELLRRFRKMPALHRIPIMMVTSLGKQQDVVRGFQLGADDYILKPFSPREFQARVLRFLEKQPL